MQHDQQVSARNKTHWCDCGAVADRRLPSGWSCGPCVEFVKAIQKLLIKLVNAQRRQVDWERLEAYKARKRAADRRRRQRRRESKTTYQ